MTRFVLSILTTLFLFVSSGIAISSHYCMGRLVEVALGGVQDTDGCCAVADESASCCSSQFYFLKLTIDQNKECSHEVNLTPSVTNLFAYLWRYTSSLEVNQYYRSQAPPFEATRQSQSPHFILYRKLII